MASLKNLRIISMFFFFREKSLLAVTLSNEVEEILGHAAFLDYPNVDGVEPDAWVDWLMSSYELAQCNPLNTLFMHYFVAKQSYSNGCAREIIRTMFNTIPNVHFCLLLVPSGVQPGELAVYLASLCSKCHFICHHYYQLPKSRKCSRRVALPQNQLSWSLFHSYS